MTTITLNLYDKANIKSVLDHLKANPEREYVFRICLEKDNISEGDIDIPQEPARRSFDQGGDDERIFSEPLFLPYNGKDTPLQAIMDLIKERKDCDVMLPMGYTLFECKKAVNQSKVTWKRLLFRNQTRMIAYLKAIGARHIEDEDETKQWTGKEVRDHNRGAIISTMIFETSHIYKKMSYETALLFLEGHLKEQQKEEQEGIDPSLITTSQEYSSTVIVTKNGECSFVLPKEGTIVTEADTYQRLMYLHECIVVWLNRVDRKQLIVNLGEETFEYKITDANIWGTEPDNLDEKGFAMKFSLSIMPEFAVFKNSRSPKARVETMLHFFEDYGIRVPSSIFQGDIDRDFVDMNTSFELPSRSRPAIIQAIANPNATVTASTRPANTRPAHSATKALKAMLSAK
jgi:hypothetical protein